MRAIIIVFFCIISISVFSQNEKNIKLKKSFRITKTDRSVNLKFPEKQTITLDTTIIEIDSSQLSFLKDFSLLDNKNLVKRYKWHAFRHYKNRNITQIIGPLVIFIDSDLPKNVKSEFIKFIKDIPKINNLSFAFTNDFEKANYFIDVMDNEVSSYSYEEKLELSEAEIKDITFSQMTYKFYANNDHKLLSCHFKISRSIINDDLFLIKLKKGFFRSLGNFFESKYAPKESILYNKPIIETKYITDYDIMMLKYHYQHLYDFKVDSEIFDSLIILRKKIIK